MQISSHFDHKTIGPSYREPIIGGALLLHHIIAQ